MLGANTTGISFAGLANHLFLLVREPGGADHHGTTRASADLQVAEGAFRPGEIDQDIEAARVGSRIIGDRHIQAPDTRHLAGVRTQQGTARLLGGHRELKPLGLLNGLDQGAPHAPPRTDDTNVGHGMDSAGVDLKV
jgi:hypothetical protein